MLEAADQTREVSQLVTRAGFEAVLVGMEAGDQGGKGQVVCVEVVEWGAGGEGVEGCEQGLSEVVPGREGGEVGRGLVEECLKRLYQGGVVGGDGDRTKAVLLSKMSLKTLRIL